MKPLRYVWILTMKRTIDQKLIDWIDDPRRKPLLLRGARQVGKTHSVRQLGKQFKHFIEINFESRPDLGLIFEKDLQPDRIVRELAMILDRPIIPGSTLLFFDEIQAAPNAFTALRYFYEELPQLHVIAAGSLLDFTIAEVGVPVGRVSSCYIYPLSFLEFLTALGYDLAVEDLMRHTIADLYSEPVHEQLLSLVGEYLAIGGMPEAVQAWVEKKDFGICSVIHGEIIDSYRQDFNKYAKKFQIKYISVLFNHIPRQMGHKFKYSAISGDYRKRELAPCLDLLVTAGVAHQVFSATGNGLPVGAGPDLQDFKVLFLDVALCQVMLGLQAGDWIIKPLEMFANKGELVEAFVGQELLAYANSSMKQELYYWRRNAPSSQAEVDYLIQQKENIIPIEVKSGAGSTLKSMHMFLDSHPKSPYGIRFSTQQYSVHQKIHSYPLYAIAQAIGASQQIVKL